MSILVALIVMAFIASSTVAWFVWLVQLPQRSRFAVTMAAFSATITILTFFNILVDYAIVSCS